MRKGLGVLFSALLCAAGAGAQMGPSAMMRPPAIQGVWNPVVGAGAVYENTDKKQEKHAFEISIVGKESVNGKDAYWMEFGAEGVKSGGMVYAKMLITEQQGGMITERMIVQVPGQPQPLDMTMQVSSRMNREQQAADFHSKAERVGSETISVPAGTFSCEHWRMKDGSGDIWFNAKVVPWGLVKFAGKDSTMILTKTITDAKDHITGKPMSIQDMMRQRMQEPH